MLASTLMGYVRAQPFRSFRIVLTSGRKYDVRHPELIRVGRDSFVLFHAVDPEGPYDHWETASLLLIEHIEFLETAVA
jgi:hypothetical protein